MAHDLRQPVPLSAEDFEKAVQSLIEDAENYVDANWKGPREEGWERYKGKVDARPEVGGDSTVAYEVRDAVQQLLPEIMEQLAGSEEPVEYYDDKDPQKADLCRRATRYAHALWWERHGWTALYDAVMHAGVGRVGCLKVYRREKLCMEEGEIDGPPDEIDAVLGMPGYVLMGREDLEAELRDELGNQVLDELGQPMLHVAQSIAQVRRYYVEPTLEFEAVDPARIICTQTTDEDEALCVGEKATVRMADLRAMGFEPGELLEVEGYDSAELDERAARTDEASEELRDYGTWALKPIDLYEVYVRVDADGDGLLELWKVIAAGTDKKVLRQERVEQQPYVLFPMRRSPHTIQGLSVPDLISDLQEVRTKILRGTVDNVDSVNSPMILASGTVNWASLQTWRKNKVVDERVPNSVRWFAPPPTAGETLPVLEYLSGIVEQRIGAGRAAQGLQPDQLTSVSAVAVAGAQAAAQKAIKLTCRTIAELGLRSAFKKLLRLMVGEPPRAVVGDNGEYQIADPRKFDPAWGVRVRVGLGAMAVEERKGAYRELIGLCAQLIPAPPPYSRIIDAPRLAALIQAAVSEYRGLGAARFFAPPEKVAEIVAQMEQQGPPPDPKMIEAQGKLQIQGQKAAADVQLQQAKTRGDMAAKAQDGWLRYQAKLAEVASDERLGRIELAQEAELERLAIQKGARGGQGNIPRSSKR